jgi:hypothetical protein
LAIIASQIKREEILYAVEIFEDIVKLLFLLDRESTSVLTVYFDESYNHRTEKNLDEPLVYTVACWLSTAQQWLLFGKKWRSALSKYGLEFFHMTDYEARRSEYGLWSKSKRIGVLKEFHSIVNKHTIFGCSSSVICADYDALIAPIPRYADYFGRNYYDFDVRVCMHKLKDWCNAQGYGGTVQYVFASMAKQGSALDRMFREVLELVAKLTFQIAMCDDGTS